MVAPLIQRLQDGIRAAENDELRAELAAQVACYQARVGEFNDAERIRSELRSTYNDGRSPTVSIRIMCAEGLLLFYRALDPGARDRLFRANLLSVALGIPKLIALTSAWLAHVDFNAGRFESMAKSAAASLATLHGDDGSAECRISLVLGDAFLYAGNEEVSRSWYERARLSANLLGDHAAVGALTYNRSALRLARARIDGLGVEIDCSRIALICSEIRSAVNYQAVAQLKSLDHLLLSASASSLILEERYSDASLAILKLIVSTEVPAGSAELALLYSDNAFCLAKTGGLDLAAEMAAAAVEINAANFDFDDQALIFDGLGKYYAAVNDEDCARKFRSMADQALSKHKETIERLTQLLAPLVAVPRLGN